MKKIISVIIPAFVLNFFWEVSQSFLYAPHYEGISGLIGVHLLASLIDVVIVAVILLLNELIFSIVSEEKEKFKNRKLPAVILLGLIFSVLLEKYALKNGMWSYNAWMPIIPWLNVGLTPVFQMMLIPPIVWKFFKAELK